MWSLKKENYKNYKYKNVTTYKKTKLKKKNILQNTQSTKYGVTNIDKNQTKVL